MRFLFRIIHRIWLRSERKWITDCIADEKQRHLDYPQRMKALNAALIEIDHKLEGSKPARLRTLWPRDPARPV